MHQQRDTRISSNRHRGADHRREGRFAEGAESEAGQRDAELHGGNDAVQIPEQALDDAGADITFAGELAHARQAHGDQGEFSRRKKAVERDQREDAYEADGEHKSVGIAPGRIVAAGARLDLGSRAKHQHRRQHRTNRVDDAALEVEAQGELQVAFAASGTAAALNQDFAECIGLGGV